MGSPLTETWQIHDRINRYVLDAIAESALGDIAASKGRIVGEQFAHIHAVRLMWLKAADPELCATQHKLEKDGLTKAGLHAALTESGIAVTKLLEKAEASGGKVKGFKPHATAFCGYLILHESHHRGQIALALKQSGHPLDKKVAYGIWEWGSR
jgi:uncharacterized damage-inducible protein DinB